MPRLTSAHLAQIAKGAYLRPVLEVRAPWRVAGLMTLVRDEPSDLLELWALLDDQLASSADFCEPGDYYGITWYPACWEQRGFPYIAAVAIDVPAVTSTPLVVKPLPAQTYVHFIHKGPRHELPLTMDYIYHIWLPKSGRDLAHPLVIERYNQNPVVADNSESEIGIYLPLKA
jgi:predicted transcriptional regulator YdeE